MVYSNVHLTAFPMNIDTLISMMLAPILIKLAEQLIGWISQKLRITNEYVHRLFGDAEVKLTATQYLGNSMYVGFQENNATRRIMTVITDRLMARGCIIPRGYTRLVDKKLVISADNTVKYKGYTLLFSTYQRTQKELSYVEKQLIIRHKSMDKIRKFLDKCNAEVAKQTDMSFKQQFYGQTKTNKGRTIHIPLTFSADATFDDMFFPEKSAVVASVDKLIAGKIPKLSFFLHGEPGCGKSTMIKAIAAKTGYSVVEIKLSFVENDSELRNIVFGSRVNILNGDDHSHHEVDTSRRIYLFEDIDAECDVVYRRELQAVKKPKKQTKKSDDVSVVGKTEEETVIPSKTQSLTLSGILNVLDGVIPIRGVVVITTNHPEKLDPALTRFGRVTHNIKMGRLSAECGGQLVRKFHPEWTGTIPDGKYTPAELEAICQTHTSAEMLEIIG